MGVIQRIGIQAGGITSSHKPVTVVQRAALNGERALAQHTAIFTAVTVRECSPLDIHREILSRLQQAAIIVQFTAHEPQRLTTGNNTTAVIQRTTVDGQGPFGGDISPVSISQATGLNIHGQ
ncbi:hypothetical protein D3C80_1469470 [compost metagenome]